MGHSCSGHVGGVRTGISMGKVNSRLCPGAIGKTCISSSVAMFEDWEELFAVMLEDAITFRLSRPCHTYCRPLNELCCTKDTRISRMDLPELGGFSMTKEMGMMEPASAVVCAEMVNGISPPPVIEMAEGIDEWY